MVALPSAPRKFQELRMKLQRSEAVHPERGDIRTGVLLRGAQHEES